MEIIKTIILGIVQGIGEFLPISSSAHLILVPYLFNWEPSSMAYDIALHFGTLAAVLVIFFKDWWKLFIGAVNKITKGKDSFDNKMFCSKVSSVTGFGFSPRGAQFIILSPSLSNSSVSRRFVSC